MLEFLCTTKKGKHFRCLVRYSDIVEVEELADSGNAVITLKWYLMRNNRYLETVEDYETVCKKVRDFSQNKKTE